MHHTSLPRVQRDLKTLQVKWKRERVAAFPSNDINLLVLVPARETVDRLAHLYFDTFESVYRIVHIPTFWKEYHSFWEAPKKARPAFIVMLLLVMAAVSCISGNDRPSYIGDSATAREQAIVWIHACDTWVPNQSRKNSYLAIWQIQCLSLLAKQANTIKKKRAWTSAGNVVRNAMAAGFHRDPSLLGTKISVFDQEMRRRLWATMVELELQASIDRGMPSALVGIPCDCAPATNINDEDFGEDSETLPDQKPWTQYTETSFLHMSRSSLSLRVSLNSLVNELNNHPQYEDILTYEEKINLKLREIPSENDTGVLQKRSKFPDLVRTLLDIQLRQFLILLHSPFARQPGSDSRHALSRMICLDAASSILDQHSKLLASSNLTLCVFRNDVFRGALVMCHNMNVSSTIQSEFLRTISSRGRTNVGQMILLFMIQVKASFDRLGTPSECSRTKSHALEQAIPTIGMFPRHMDLLTQNYHQRTPGWSRGKQSTESQDNITKC